MADADPIRALNAQRVKHARTADGYSLNSLAAQVENVRALRGDEDIPSRDSLARTIANIEKTGVIGDMWRADLAAVFGADPDEFFEVPTATRLPPPLLLHLPVDHDVLTVIATQQSAHIAAEHTFGPLHARPLIERDLTTVEALVKSAPVPFRATIRQAAGTIAEIAGWIAQDIGDYDAAMKLTYKAALNLRDADPALRAMIAMRQSNILTRSDTDNAVQLADEAAALIDGRDVGRLAATIARQQALAALADHDERGFHRHAARALELGHIEPVSDDHAIYAHAGFVASEIAAGYLHIGNPAKAVELLTAHHPAWTAHQLRDRSVADLRLMHAYIAVREYRLAAELAHTAIPAYLATPSQRGRRHLAKAGSLVRDRRRHDSNNRLLQHLAGRIKLATEGTATP